MYIQLNELFTNSQLHIIIAMLAYLCSYMYLTTHVIFRYLDLLMITF